MVALFWETALLLLGAYFAGAFLGCIIRRVLFPGTIKSPEPVQAAAAGAGAVAATASTAVRQAGDDVASERFGRALTGEGISEQTTTATSTVSASTTAATTSERVSDQIDVAGDAAQSEPAAPVDDVSSRMEEIKPGLSDATERPTRSSEIGAGEIAATAAVAGAAATAVASALSAKGGDDTQTGEIPKKPEEVMPPRDTVGNVAARHADTWTPSVAGRQDDLANIEGIDDALAGRLREAGVTSYAQIAGWTAADVEAVSMRLDLGDAVTHQNWIEQAAVLAQGKATAYSARRQASGDASLATPSDDSGVSRNIERELDAGIEIPGAAAAAAVSAGLAAGAAALQSRTGEADGEPEPPQVQYPVAATTADGATVAAQIETVDFGGNTDGRYGGASSTTPSEAQPSTPLSAGLAGAAAAAATSVVAAGAAAVQRRESEDRASAGAAFGSSSTEAVGGLDDLTRINGINDEIARVLHGHGVTRFSQVANWTAADVQRFDGLLGRERIGREDWVGQAAVLSRQGGDGLQAMRSVKSEALVSSAPAGASAAIAAAAAAGGLGGGRQRASAGPSDPSPFLSRPGAAPTGDDLKRIRGVGILIERRLNQMGIRTYEEIANWTADDISRVSQALDFSGRIERENWIEQARILASGGQTEFSRRMDRGEA